MIAEPHRRPDLILQTRGEERPHGEQPRHVDQQKRQHPEQQRGVISGGASEFAGVRPPVTIAIPTNIARKARNITPTNSEIARRYVTKNSEAGATKREAGAAVGRVLVLVRFIRWWTNGVSVKNVKNDSTGSTRKTQ